jgi:SAM-dependent methyltransferase
MIARLRRAFHPLWRRHPRLRSLVLGGVDFAVRPVLALFRLTRPASDRGAAAAIEARTDAFNRAAEVYFVDADPGHLRDKPFSEPESLSRRLMDVGILLDALRLAPGDSVLEVGAGTCWLSHFLNRYGCRTIAVDVSAAALDMGRQLFERDPRTRWELQPAFTVYDGRTLPLERGAVDRIVLYDAYHHLPNPRELLAEFRRVLADDGILAMSEPGRGHAASASSHAEAAAGVLENELVLEDIAELALAAGFTAARVVVATNRPLAEVDAAGLRRFMGGRGFARYWRDLCAELDGHHYLLLFAGDPAVTTRRPKRLHAVLTLVDTPPTLHLTAGRRGAVTVGAYNAGDTRWLHREGQPGWTRLGAHLYRSDARRTLVDYDWLRAPLSNDVAPEQSIPVGATLPAIEEPGAYEIVFDLVVEGTAWFADRGSVPLVLPCLVAEG